MQFVERTKYMDLAEVKILRDSTEVWASKDLRHGRRMGVVTWALVDLALSTGLRLGEMAALRVGNLDVKRSGLIVTRLKRKVKRPEFLNIGPELLEHLQEFIQWKSDNDEPVTARATLLCGKRGPLTRRGLQNMWKRAIAEAELDGRLSIHSARHTLAVHLLKKTCNLRQTQKQLGHANPSTTANMYADVSDDDMRAGVTGLYD